MARDCVALCLIVKNEEKVIARCIESAAQVATKVFCIDTGSTDRTVETIVQTCKHLELDYKILSSEWKSFGENRTELVQAASGYADWLLLLDADMTISLSDDFRIPPGYDSFKLWYSGSTRYAQKLLVSSLIPWRYVGRTHEYITTDSPDHEGATLKGIEVNHHADGSNRADKWNRDLALLSEDLLDPERQGQRSRTLFYLGQTCEDLGRNKEAALFYSERAAAGGWEEERWLAQMRHAKLTKSLEGLLSAYNARSRRAEPMYYLSELCRHRGLHGPAMIFARHGCTIARPDDVLFVEDWIYDWGLLMEESISMWYCGDREGSRTTARWLLQNKQLPLHIIHTLTNNLEC